MKLRTLGYAAIMTVATAAFVIGAAGSSEAKGKKKAMAAPAKQAMCMTTPAPVCGTRGGMKFTYVNSCYAANDGAKVMSMKACPTKGMKKMGMKKMSKKPMKKG